MNFTTRTCVPQFVAEYLADVRSFMQGRWLDEDYGLWYNSTGFKSIFGKVSGYEQFEPRCKAAMSNPKNTPEDILLILSM